MFAKLAAATAGMVAAWAALAGSSEGAGRERTYVVRPGDTLWAIAAARYRGDPRAAVWAIKQRNGLEGALLRPGQRLVLPRR